MTTATITAALEPINFRSIVRGFGAKLRRALELAGAPYTIEGARYL